MSNESIQICPDEEEDHFTMVPNELLRNPNISPQCKWFISYLLSHRKGYEIKIPFIMQNQKISKDRIYSLVDEAIESGYLKRKDYLEKGRKRCKYFVSKTPRFKIMFQLPENQDPENQDAKEYQLKEYYKVGDPDSPASSEASVEKHTKEKAAQPPKRKVPAEPASPAAHELCVLFYEKLKEMNPKHKKPNMSQWGKDMDLLLRIDKRSGLEVKLLIDWIFKDPFWKKNILSPRKLREKYDGLWIKAFSDKEDPVQAQKDENTRLVKEIKEGCPNMCKNLYIYNKTGHAIDSKRGVDLWIGMNPKDFKDRLLGAYPEMLVNA